MKPIIIFAIKFYQKFVSPLLGHNCRFFPSCSEYAILAIQKFGVAKGILKTFLRLVKCHPLSSGGVDFP